MPTRSRPAPKAARHPIQIVTRRTGLSPAVLRMWERRHGVVKPTRSPKGRRLYSDEDVERLRLLARATHGGRTIGQLAGLSLDALTQLVRQDAAEERVRDTADLAPPARRLLEDAMSMIERLEASALDALLRRGMIALPAGEFLDHVVAPLLHETGERWRAGTLRPVHGQLTATVVRRVLERVRDEPPPRNAPEIIVATPAGQRHELGALMVAAAAAAEGWSVTYLGADLPAEDLAEAVRVTGARVLALSIVHPSGDRALAHELRTLGAQLPRATVLLVGGSAAAAYAPILDRISGERLADLEALRTRLRAIR
jgi:DNA-binding transcriptional MerR regulator/methylmalonyl-CoA mutase cobalamin-binding subunit